MSSLSTPGIWQPLLTGELAERADRAIDRIADGLPRLASDSPNAASLGNGCAGQALFWAYLASVRQDEAAADQAEVCLDAAFDELASRPLAPHLYSGFPGTGWVAEHLQGFLFESDETDGEAESEHEIDTALLSLLETDHWTQSYDLIRGLVGLGVYALEGLPRPTARSCLERVVELLSASSRQDLDGVAWFTPPALLLPFQRARAPDGYYDLGVAHGVPGVIALLAAACQAGVAVATARPLLDSAVRWLLSKRLGDGGPICFPASFIDGHVAAPARLAWCYGDAGIAATLLNAARLTRHATWEKEAVAIARTAAGCPFEKTGVVDAGLCHGAAGLGHLFNRLYQATGDTTLAEAARFWLGTALDGQRSDGETGFFGLEPVDEKRSEWLETPGFLTGAAGIGLAFLAARSTLLPEWDRVLLMAIPPLAA